MYADFLLGKKSLNFDSGKIASTFLTFSGLSDLSGLMASTDSLSRLHTVVALRFFISSVIGSEVSLPHSVPDEQSDEDPVEAVAEAVVATGVVVTDTVVVAVVVVDTSPPYITSIIIMLFLIK